MSQSDMPKSDIVPLNSSSIRLLKFLRNHNEERFNFSELSNMRFFSSNTRLNYFLKVAIEKSWIKKTIVYANGRKFALYEIKAKANEFVDFL